MRPSTPQKTFPPPATVDYGGNLSGPPKYFHFYLACTSALEIQKAFNTLKKLPDLFPEHYFL